MTGKRWVVANPSAGLTRQARRMAALGPRVAHLARVMSFLGAVLGICVGLVTPALTPGMAHAATAYRYWSYFVTHDANWHYSQRGPAAQYVQDGAAGEVQGWRFAVQADGAAAIEPRVAPSFSTLCAKTPAQSGQVRVGIVLDFGLASDAPTGETPRGTVAGCVRVPNGATGMDVLIAAVGSGGVRIGTGADVGLVCGIAGYPRSECAPVVEIRQPSAQPTRPTEPTKAPAPTAAAPTATATRTDSAGAPLPAGPAVSASAAAAAAAAAVPASPVSPASLESAATASASASRSRATESGAASLAPNASAVALSSLAVLRHPTHHKPPIGAILVAAVVVVLGVAAAWRAKLRR